MFAPVNLAPNKREAVLGIRARCFLAVDASDPRQLIRSALDLFHLPAQGLDGLGHQGAQLVRREKDHLAPWT
jgi:hypothetical protein